MSTNVKPEVGMGATHIMWTDRHAYTVISVSLSGKKCIVQRDKAKRTDNNGMSESQGYLFEPDPDGKTHEIKLGKDGYWYTAGGKKNGKRFSLGARREYYDYSF